MSKRHPEVVSEGHVTVRCGASGREVPYIDGTAFLVTLADLEAFCAACRGEGAADDVCVDNGFGDGPRGREGSAMTVTLRRGVS